MNDSTRLHAALGKLARDFDGAIETGSLHRSIYATDASVYQETPLAVAFPKSESDIRKLILFAKAHQTSLIPRTAGTSLAGQVVGSGIVVDVSHHFVDIGDVDLQKRTVVVQPGVVRDRLNGFLAADGLMFGPETSTSNRAMIGGMVGNNSCGSNSIVYGTTRDQTISLTGFLSDGSKVTFEPVTAEQFAAKCELESLEGDIYRKFLDMLGDPDLRDEVSRSFPKANVSRRNTGYAVDALMDCDIFRGTAEKRFNLCQLLAGSEGTLFFTTSVTLQLHELPPPENGLLCVHFESVDQSLRANIIAMQHNVFASELIDNLVLEGAQRNLSQRENLQFVQGTPGAILVLSLRGKSVDDITQQAALIEKQLRDAGLGYAFPMLRGDDIRKIWDLRKAGLGVVANVVGDSKPVAVIEDTAVAIEDLPAYIREIDQLLDQKYDCRCVYYAHAGSGEIHLRPVLNLKTDQGVSKFREIATDVAAIVKKYRGSLSGEHGDGRLRAEFLESMVGPKCYRWMKEIKQLFDPAGIFNPGKIVDATPMDVGLRFEGRPETIQLNTVFDFDNVQGIQRSAEMCSGSGDCRKSAAMGGTMCPSFMATGREKDSTRARANTVRNVLAAAANARQGDGKQNDGNPLVHEDIAAAMSLCLSCKACKSECPSNVDVGKIKAEFLQAWQDERGRTLRTRFIANLDRMNRLGSRMPGVANFLAGNSITGGLLKQVVGFAKDRSMPKIAKVSFERWFGSHQPAANAGSKGKVNFFADEFTNFNDPAPAIAAVEVLERLGWQVNLPRHVQSGRALISKGCLREAKKVAAKNVSLLKDLVSDETPLVSVEPSAILTFRDEYVALLRGSEQSDARELARNCLTFSEFVGAAVERGDVGQELFTNEKKIVRLHGHCHEKALVGLVPAIRTLSLPTNYKVRLIPSGCCGMAGSFGYEAESYDVSMRIGELVLFPAIRSEPESSLIAASGVSCRHQILDGTDVTALHPAEILRASLLEPANIATS